MSSSEPDYVSKATGKRYRLVEAKPSGACRGCAFAEDGDETRAGRAITKQRIADCDASRGCIVPKYSGPSGVFQEITE